LENKKVGLPQFTMDYSLGGGISTRKFFKYIRFHKAYVKGTYVEEEKKSYPYGYDYTSDETFPRNLIEKYSK